MTELEVMDESTLAWEAQGPCVKAATIALAITDSTIGKRREAQRYLMAIITARRKKDGKAPLWLYDLAIQAEKGSIQGCNDVARKIYLPPETSAEGQEQGQQAQEVQSKKAAAKKKKE